MNLFKKAIFVLMIGLLSTSAQAKSPKIAVADQMTALMNSKAAKKMVKELQGEMKPEEKKINNLENEIRALIDKSNKDAAVMSDSQKRKLEKDLEEKKVDHRFMAQKLQKRLQEAQQDILKELGPKFKEAAESVVKSGGYDLVLQKQAVIHAVDAIDITADMTKKFDSM